MKQIIIRSSLLIIVLFLNVVYLHAQDKPLIKVPRWVSEKGYWVVETSGESPSNHTIYFYNNDNNLMYRESVTRSKFKPSGKKAKMKLKKVLETSVLNWEAKNKETENLHLVAKAFKN